MVIIGIVVLPLIFSLTITYAEPDVVRVLTVHELSREYRTSNYTATILGVNATIELTLPYLVVNGENHTFTYRVIVGNAPSGWRLNITEVVFTGCFRGELIQKVAKVLKGGELLRGQFAVKTESNLNPGSSDICSLEVEMRYFVEFGTNRDGGSIRLRDIIPIKSKELPLELRPDIIMRELYGLGYKYFINLSGKIVIKNIQNQDITLTGYYSCKSDKPHPVSALPKLGHCESKKALPPSTVLKPGKEYVIDIKDLHSFYYKEPLFYVVYVIEYLYTGGSAENWVLLKISPFDESPRGTAPGLTAPFFWNNVALVLASVALATITAAAIAAWKELKSLPTQRKPEVVQAPSEPSAQPALKATEPAPPGLAQTVSSSQPEQLKLKPPPSFLLQERASAILSKLSSARDYAESGYYHYAMLDLYRAVNATISFILEADGLSPKGPDGKELAMKEKLKLLAERGWVKPKDIRRFRLLHRLRNEILHSPEKLHDLPRLFFGGGLYFDYIFAGGEFLSFFENFIKNSLKKLKLWTQKTSIVEIGLMLMVGASPFLMLAGLFIPFTNVFDPSRLVLGIILIIVGFLGFISPLIADAISKARRSRRSRPFRGRVWSRRSEIQYKLQAARRHLDTGNVNDAILDLHLAVNMAATLILEAEGIDPKQGRSDLPFREKFRLLAERGWVRRKDARYFRRLHELRNAIEHSPELMHVPQTTASEVEELLRFHEDFIRTSLRKLGPLLMKVNKNYTYFRPTPDSIHDWEPLPQYLSFEYVPTRYYKVDVENISTSTLRLSYSIGEAFEAIIRDGSGRVVFVHSDTLLEKGEYRKEVALPPGRIFSDYIRIPLVYTRNDLMGKPLPPGTYTLTVYLTATIDGYQPEIIDGIKAFAAKSIEITVYDLNK
jgi:HEPN domain-containing protein